MFLCTPSCGSKFGYVTSFLCLLYWQVNWSVDVSSVYVPDRGEVYTWGWKECVPSGKMFTDLSAGAAYERDVLERQSSSVIDQGTVQTYL